MSLSNLITSILSTQLNTPQSQQQQPSSHLMDLSVHLIEHYENGITSLAHQLRRLIREVHIQVVNNAEYERIEEEKVKYEERVKRRTARKQVKLSNSVCEEHLDPTIHLLLVSALPPISSSSENTTQTQPYLTLHTKTLELAILESLPLLPVDSQMRACLLHGYEESIEFGDGFDAFRFECVLACVNEVIDKCPVSVVYEDFADNNNVISEDDHSYDKDYNRKLSHLHIELTELSQASAYINTPLPNLTKNLKSIISSLLSSYTDKIEDLETVVCEAKCGFDDVIVGKNCVIDVLNKRVCELERRNGNGNGNSSKEKEREEENSRTTAKTFIKSWRGGCEDESGGQSLSKQGHRNRYQQRDKDRESLTLNTQPQPQADSGISNRQSHHNSSSSKSKNRQRQETIVVNDATNSNSNTNATHRLPSKLMTGEGVAERFTFGCIGVGSGGSTSYESSATLNTYD